MACHGAKSKHSSDPAPLPSAPGATVGAAGTTAPAVTTPGSAPISEEDKAAIASLPIAYEAEEYRAVAEVYKDFGELTIDPALVGNDFASAKAILVQTPDGSFPWAGYWYPKRLMQLFDGDQSPLAKLDNYFVANGLQAGAQDAEKNSFDDNAAEWEGLCDAWAVASISTKEPTQSFKVMGVTFSPSDLKAIATKYFEGYHSKIYGRRYLGGPTTDGQIQDLRPEAFHKLAEEIIGKQHRALLVDEDPGPEIWSKPIFRMSYKYIKDPDHANAILVQAFPWMIRQRASVDDAPTDLATDLAAPAYEYRLYYAAGSSPLKVVAGEWIGASIDFHPDIVFIPGDTQNTNQYNLSVKQNSDVVRKLLVKVGMLTE
jgi:hypothetical protein